MIDGIVQMALLSGDRIRKSIGQFHNIREFLSDTYGTVIIKPYIRLENPFSEDAHFVLRLNYFALRNDKIPILTEGIRRFEETMDTIAVSEYSDKSTNVEEDILFYASCRERYVRQFYGRGAVIEPVTKNF